MTSRKKYESPWCVHYRAASSHDTCEAGIRYADVKDTDSRPYRMPCFRNGSLAGGKPCASCRFPTPEEDAAEDARVEAMIARIGTARAAIVEHTGGKRGVGGTIPCPCCEGGQLRFSVSGYNGHIHAACTTEGCAQWME